MAQDEPNNPQNPNQEQAQTETPTNQPKKGRQKSIITKQDGIKLPKKPANMGRTQKTPDNVKAAIIACLLSAQFPTDEAIAKEVNVSKTVVSKLKAQIPPEILNQLEIKKADRIGQLVEEMLEESLESLKRIAAVTKDDIWLKQQNAAELATLYGVKADKIIKILEAIERANAQGTTGEGDSQVSAVSEG